MLHEMFDGGACNFYSDRELILLLIVSKVPMPCYDEEDDTIDAIHMIEKNKSPEVG